MTARVPVQRKCKSCGEAFKPSRQIQPACSHACEAAFALAKVERAQAKRMRDDSRATREKLEALKGIPKLKHEAQQAFNAFIRARDRAAGHPCISSGRALDWSGNMTDAGHYRSTGAADHLRFNEDNCHAQTKHENRDKAGNAVEYRIGLIQRIGLERVEALECDNRLTKWTRDYLREVRDHYRAKARAITKGNA